MSLNAYWGNDTTHTLTFTRLAGYTDSLIGAAITFYLGRNPKVEPIVTLQRDDGIAVDSEAADSLTATIVIPGADIKAALPEGSYTLKYEVQVQAIGATPQTFQGDYLILPTFAQQAS